MIMARYKGITFKKYEYNKSIIANDIELVNIDLYNHIFTRIGSRVHMSDFGTIIPDMLFEPITEPLLIEVQQQLENVFNYDPRVTLNSLKLYPIYDRNLVYVTADLTYIELDFTGRFDINLEFKG